jgi:hypothetical protein
VVTDSKAQPEKAEAGLQSAWLSGSAAAERQWSPVERDRNAAVPDASLNALLHNPGHDNNARPADAASIRRAVVLADLALGRA